MDGELTAFERWYNRVFRTRGVDTKHQADCEDAWNAALTAQQQETVAFTVYQFDPYTEPSNGVWLMGTDKAHFFQYGTKLYTVPQSGVREGMMRAAEMAKAAADLHDIKESEAAAFDCPDSASYHKAARTALEELEQAIRASAEKLPMVERRTGKSSKSLWDRRERRAEKLPQDINDSELIAYLRNHAKEIIRLVEAAAVMCGQAEGDDLEAEAQMVEALAALNKEQS